MEYKDVFNYKSLIAAWKKVIDHKTKAGIDSVMLSEYGENLEENINQLLFELDYGLYNPTPVNMIPSKKEVGLLTINDKIVANVLASTLNRIAEDNSIEHNYGYIKNRSTFQAIDYIVSTRENYPFAFRCDIEHFFPSISRTILYNKISRLIFDEKLLSYIKKFIELPCYQEGKFHKGHGLLLGSPVSPALSNIYLADFDHECESLYPVYVRYSDDLYLAKNTIFMPNEIEKIKNKLIKLNLAISEKKSEYLNIESEFIFLGHPFSPDSKSSRIYIDDVLDVNENEEVKSCNSIKNSDNGLSELEHMINEQCEETVRDSYKKLYQQYKEKKGTMDSLLADFEELCIQNNDYSLLEKINSLCLQEENQDIQKNELREGVIDCYEHLFLKGIASFSIGKINSLGLCDFITLTEVPSGKECFDLLEKDGICAVAPAKEGKSRIYVIDIDINKQLLLKIETDDDLYQQMLLRLRGIALNIQKLLLEAKIFSYVEFSGYKGYHIWIFYDTLQQIDKVWSKLNWIVSGINLPVGCHIEYIPELGEELIKIPYSTHWKSHTKSTYIDEQGKITEKEYILKIKENRWLENDGEMKVEGEERGVEHYIYAVEENCQLIQYIIQKAKTTNYLTHYERNALLYIYGHMGEGGKKYLHNIISYCMNYNQEITQGFIEKIKEFPVSCDKLCKRFKDLPCGKCSFEQYPLFYPSPIIYAYSINPTNVRKPDYVNKKQRMLEIEKYTSPDKLTNLKDLLIDLTKKRKEIDKEIHICEQKINAYFDEEKVSTMPVEGGELVRDARGIYLKLL